MFRLFPVSKAVVLTAMFLSLAACKQSRHKSFSFHMDGPPDKCTMGKLTVATNPPGATVSLKVDMDVIARMHVDGHEVEQVNPPDVDVDLKDWTVLGTTPIEDIPLPIRAHWRKSGMSGSAQIDTKLNRVSVRIEKAGYETIELENVALRNSGTVLNLDLQPTPATQEVAEAE